MLLGNYYFKVRTESARVFKKGLSLKFQMTLHLKTDSQSFLFYSLVSKDTKIENNKTFEEKHIDISFIHDQALKGTVANRTCHSIIRGITCNYTYSPFKEAKMSMSILL